MIIYLFQIITFTCIIGHVPSLQVNFLWRKIKIFFIFTFDFSGGIYSLVNVNAILCSLKGKCMNFFLPLCESVIVFNVFRVQLKTKWAPSNSGICGVCECMSVCVCNNVFFTPSHKLDRHRRFRNHILVTKRGGDFFSD